MKPNLGFSASLSFFAVSHPSLLPAVKLFMTTRINPKYLLIRNPPLFPLIV
jgi:hypothetical protein